MRSRTAAAPVLAALGSSFPVDDRMYRLYRRSFAWVRDAALGLAPEPRRSSFVRRTTQAAERGAANAFFTPANGDWLQQVSPELVDIYGQDAIDEYIRLPPEDRERVSQLFDELDQAIYSLLSTTASADVQAVALEYASKVAWQREGMARPIAHFLGEIMVAAIQRDVGENTVLAAIRDLSRFIPAYQAAAQAEGLPILRPETVGALEAFWSA